MTTEGHDPVTGCFLKGNKGGPGQPRGYVKQNMRKLVEESMRIRGDRIARALGEDATDGDNEGGPQAYVNSLPNDIFAKHMVAKMVPNHEVITGDDEGGPVQLNIIHYGRKPDEKLPEQETDDE